MLRVNRNDFATRRKSGAPCGAKSRDVRCVKRIQVKGSEPMRFTITAALLIVSAATPYAQERPESCNTFFTMYLYDQRSGLIAAPGMTRDQSEWFQDKGKQKYPGFCISTERATYVLVTVRWMEGQEQTATRTESTITSGPDTSVTGEPNNGAGQTSQPMWRAQLGKMVSAWQKQAKDVVREPHATVLVFATKDGNPLSATAELRADPVLQAKGVGKTAGRDALEYVLKNWNMKLAGKDRE